VNNGHGPRGDQGAQQAILRRGLSERKSTPRASPQALPARSASVRLKRAARGRRRRLEEASRNGARRRFRAHATVWPPRSGPAQLSCFRAGRWLASAGRCCNKQGLCHDQSSGGSQATFEAAGAPPCCGAADSAPGYCLRVGEWSVRVGQPGAGSRGPNQLLRCGPGAAPAPACREQRLLFSLRRREDKRVSRADLLQLIAGSGGTQHLPRPAQSRGHWRGGRRTRTCSKPTTSGQGHRPETAPPHPQRGGRRPQPARMSP